MLTMKEIYTLKLAFKDRNNYAAYDKVFWSEEDPNKIYYTDSLRGANSIETVLPGLIELENRDILITKYEGGNYPTVDRRYYVYFRSVTESGELNHAQYLLRKDYPSFLILRQGVLLSTGEHQNTWVHEDEIFFTDHLHEQIEDIFLYLPENRLRFITGELRKAT